MPAHWLIGAQLFRVLGAVFLVLLSAHRLPAAFAWPAGIGDLAVGLLAPIVALRYARHPRESVALAVAWNSLGLIDLINAIAMGFLSSPSPLQLILRDAPNALIAVYPLVLVPVYLVPIAIVLHLASLRQLKAAAASHESGSAPAPQPF